jgi:3-(3-hydroxy-phenyl)propionate hydroxylase
MTEVQIKNWELLGARFLTVVDSSAKVGTSDIVVDHTGMLHNWMKRFKTSVIALRPDRFVAAANPTGLDVPAARGNLSPAANTGRHAVS